MSVIISSNSSRLIPYIVNTPSVVVYRNLGGPHNTVIRKNMLVAIVVVLVAVLSRSGASMSPGDRSCHVQTFNSSHVGVIGPLRR